MKRLLAGLLLTCALAIAAPPKPVQGHAEDETVAISATVLTPEQVAEAVGSNFGGSFAVLEVKISPKGDKPYEINYNDFLLRSESSGEHSGPLLAGQVAGAGALVIQRKYGTKANSESPAMLESMKVEMKDIGGDDHLDAVKKKILPEKAVTEPLSGLLFFPLEKEKPKNLALTYTTPAGKIRIQFR